MRARAGAVAFACVALAMSASRAAPAQLRTRKPPSSTTTTRSPPAAVPAADEQSRDLRARFGVDRAERLACSADVAEQIRGIERAGALGTPEAVQWLAQLTRDPTRACGASAGSTGAAHDPVRLALARTLAVHADDPTARTALLALLEPAQSLPGEERERDATSLARLDVARRIAALALAQTTDGAKIDKLVQLAETGGPSAPAATAALLAHPPSGTTAWSRPLGVRAIRLAARLGDRRAAGTLLEITQGSEAEARAAAIEALGALGDARVVAVALAVKPEEDARVRLAAASALTQLGAPEAAAAVEALLGEDSLVSRALPLAVDARGPGVVRALAARAASAMDPAIRKAAIAALGRNDGAEALEALVVLAGDPLVRVEALEALARSPNAGAMGTIAKLAESAAWRRDAVRAYVVRVRARGESNDAMDGVVAALGRSSDARDRALAASAEAILAGHGEGARPREAGSTRELLACARGGGPDAPSCTSELARIAGDAEMPDVEAMLASSDPVVRAHVVRGLAWSADPTAIGRLTVAYADETDARVRRPILRGLAGARSIPSAESTLAFASRFDPDDESRFIARRALRGLPVPEPATGDVAWVRVLDSSGEPPARPMAGYLWPEDGAAVPVAFDADGEALALVPAGSARLVLAPSPAAAYVRAP